METKAAPADSPTTTNARRRTVALLLALGLAGAAGGCATLAEETAPRVTVAGLEPLPSEGLEFRFALKLRLQNPAETPLVYDGISVMLDLDDKALASGVSDQRGEIPRFGEKLITVPVTISAFAALRQALGMVDAGPRVQGVPYALRGRLGGSGFGGLRFADRGRLDLPGAMRAAPAARPTPLPRNPVQ